MAKTVLKSDLSILNFLEHIPAVSRGDARIMMYDTEPVQFGMGRTVPFDIGYRAFDLAGYRGTAGGGLPYEVIRNREDMTHIQNYKKINEATAGELYHVIVLLRDEENPANGEKGWFSTDVETAPIYGLRSRKEVEQLLIDEINKAWGETLTTTTMPASGMSSEELYSRMSEIHGKSRQAVEFFERQVEQLNTTAARERLAIDRTLNLDRVLDLYLNHQMKTQDLVEYFDNADNGISGGENIAQRIRDIRQKNRKMIIEEERYTGYNEAKDMERLKSIPGGENIKPTREIMKAYEDEFKKGAVGIMGHNVASDLRWTRNLLSMIPDSKNYSYLFQEEQINAFCSMNLMKRLESMKGTDLLQTMLSANSDQLGSIFQSNLQSMPGLSGTKGKFKLEVLCQTILDMDEAQEHTAVADVDLTIDLMQKVAEDFARGELSERK